MAGTPTSMIEKLVATCGAAGGGLLKMSFQTADEQSTWRLQMLLPVSQMASQGLQPLASAHVGFLVVLSSSTDTVPVVGGRQQGCQRCNSTAQCFHVCRPYPQGSVAIVDDPLLLLTALVNLLGIPTLTRHRWVLQAGI